MKFRLASLAFVLTVTCVHAAGLDPTLYGDLHWRLIGPFRGGRVLAVSGVRGDAKHFYFGSVDGGVWESMDTGRTWQPIFDSVPVGSIGALAVAPSRPKVIYVGSGEADMRSDIAYGKGMYKSVDAGKTWTHIGLDDSYQIGKILVDPGYADVVYVAVLGHGYGPNETRGVFRSRDGGKTWQKVLYKDADTGAIDLAFGAETDTIYASLWQTRRPPWNVYPPSNGPSSGLYKSTDGGDTWTQLTQGLPAKAWAMSALAMAAQQCRHPLCADGRQKGRPVPLRRCRRATGSWSTATSASGPVAGTSAASVWIRRTRMWSMYPTPPCSNPPMAARASCPSWAIPLAMISTRLWIDPDDGDRMISGVDQGTIITQNGGKTWTHLVQPAHGPVLPRSHRQTFPLPRLWRAAGFGRRRGAEPQQHRQRRHQHAPSSMKSPPAVRAATSRPIRWIRTPSTAAP